MNPPFKECKEYIGSQKQLDGSYKSNYFSKPCYKPNEIRAIAFKLDEISKKLDK